MKSLKSDPGPRILFLDACVRPESRTRLLARRLLSHLDGKTETLNLYQTDLAPLTLEALNRRNAFVNAGLYSDPMFRYARQYRAADQIVIAAPYWDMSFPSILKVYCEAVMVLGLTFDYTPEGIPRGLCRARKLWYVTTAGGPIGSQNLGYDYVKALVNTYHGISDTACFSAENLDVIGIDPDAILARAMAEIDAAF